MSNTWMLDVLADLRVFAQQNGMSRLAERLTETAALAEDELSVRAGKRMADSGEAPTTAGIGTGRAARGRQS